MPRPAVRIVVTLALSCAAACSFYVADINRIQANHVRKADLAGSWHYLQTVTQVPPTSAFTFIGETSRTEKIRWDFQEKYLVGYRSYPLVPGSERPSTAPPGFYGEGYTENPVAAFSIESHFDIQREYNPQTGEQTNVLVENTVDRPWFDREYARVDWSRNLVTNFDFISGAQVTANLEYFIPEERGGEDAMHSERDGSGRTRYFDFVGKLFVEPDLDGCWYTWMGWAAQDCTAGEVKVRHSFALAEDESDYEPFQYDDVLMTKFGYFRSERVTYDARNGMTDSGRLYMINRFNVWERTYQRNDDGTFRRDGNGARIPIPLSQRKARTVAYYLSEQFPDDDTLWEAAQETMEQWNRAAKEGLAPVLGKPADEVTDIFTACHNPVRQGDHPACGHPGFRTRLGDLRYSTLAWVDAFQVEGPLGYGPAAVDPVTGEILSGKAHVYGAELDRWAQNALEVIQFVNSDLAVEDLIYGTHVRDVVLRRLQEDLDNRDVAAALDRIRVPDARSRLGGERSREGMARRLATRSLGGSRWDPRVAEARAAQAVSHGMGARLLNDEVRSLIAGRTGQRPDALTARAVADHDPTQMLDPVRVKQRMANRKRAIARNVTFSDAFDTSVVGLARQYEGRTDYDQIFRELRVLIFKSTAIHEVGHTVGLRHNFQGSFDSLNYHDEYWRQRPASFSGIPGADATVADLYRMNAPLPEQVDGRMRDYQYSSIMDYNYAFHSDVMGLGKYDRAALAFGYTCGHDVPPAGGGCDAPGTLALPGGGCVRDRPGVVEVYRKRRGELGDAGRKLTGTETRFGTVMRFDDSIMPNVTILEREHYTTVARAFPTWGDMGDREWMRYDDYLLATGRTRPTDPPVDTGDVSAQPVRVPYLFCSDEWVDSLLSCLMFDQGADPFEQALTYTRHYRSFYYFDAFRRDRFAWDAYETLFRYYERYFLPLSDLYQFWYFAEEGKDPVWDTYFYMAVYSAFNMLVEVMATPPYGTYCLGNNGSLVNLSDDPSRRASYQDYMESVYCQPGVQQLQVDQGEGRRRFSRFDFASGYYAFDRPLEAGHYWATTAAVWALTDPEAWIIGLDGDAGAFAITFYDFFSDEMRRVFNAVVAEDYTGFAPVFRPSGTTNQRGLQEGRLLHRPAAPFWGDDGMINPETGQEVVRAPSEQGGHRGLCDPCTADTDCAGYIGNYYTGVFCTQGDGPGNVCTRDCSGGNDDVCPGGTACDGEWCWPVVSCLQVRHPCAPTHPFGSCDAGSTCQRGECVKKDVLVETDVTYMLVDDVLFWGMLFTTSSFSTRFNDQLQVFRMGSGEEQVPDGRDFRVISFTDPINGEQYGAVVPNCEEGAMGGSAGLCDPCTEGDQCAGYVGNYYGGVFCEDRVPALGRVCMRDCGEGNEALCPTGATCTEFGDGEKYCVPVSGACTDLAGACSEPFPTGTCPADHTCVEGTCVEKYTPSPRCQHGLAAEPSGGAMLVLKGQEASRGYLAALDAYYSYDGSNPALDEQLFNQYSAARWRMERVVEMIGLVRAYFKIFGMVY